MELASTATVPEVDRSALIERVLASGARLVAITAAAGYGKSRLARAILSAHDSERIADCTDMTTVATGVRTLLRALGPFDREFEERQSRVVLALPRDGSADDRWRDVLNEALQRSDDSVTLCIENGEVLAQRPEAADLVDRMFRLRARRFVLCSRVPLDLPSIARLAPNERYHVEPSDLAFSDEEVRTLFVPFALDTEVVNRVIGVSRGWPIAVLTFLRDAREQRLADALEALEDGSEQRIGNYTLTQGLGSLSDDARKTLAAAALLGKISDGDLLAIANHPGAVSQELDLCPFVSRHGSVREVHPLAVVALASMREVGQRALVCAASTAKEPLRAAMLYLAGGEPDKAADVLDTAVAPFMMDEPTPEVAAIVASLDEDVLLRHPATWSATWMQRTYTVPLQRMLFESRVVWAALPDDAPIMVRFGVGIALINWLLVQGHADDVDPVFERLERELTGHPPDTIMPVLLAGHRKLVNVRRGERVEWEVLAPLWEAVFSTVPMVASLTQYMIRGPVMFLNGNRDEARRAFARAVDMALISHSESVLVNAAMTGAFFAWLAGQYEEFRRLVEVVRSASAPNVSQGTRHFLGCVHNEVPSRTPTGFEAPVYATYGWIIAAVRETTIDGRGFALRAAVDAAQLENQTWLRALTLALLGLVDSSARREAQAQALKLAASVQYPSFRKALGQLTRNRIPKEWSALGPLMRGTSSLDPVVVSLAGREARFGQRTIALAPREAELLLALALNAAPCDRATLAALIWPDVKESNASIVGVYVGRLRRRLGDLDLIEARGAGYALRSPVQIDLLLLEQAIQANRIEAPLDEPLEEVVASRHLRLPQWVLTSAWLAPYSRRYEAALYHIRLARARNAENRGATGEAQHYRRLLEVEAEDD